MELKLSGCFCPKYLTFLLRHVYVNRLVWTWFLHEKISIPVHLYRGLYKRPLPFWHGSSVRCAIRRGHLNTAPHRLNHHGPSLSLRPCVPKAAFTRIRTDSDVRMSQLRIGLPSTRKRLKSTLFGAIRYAIRSCSKTISKVDYPDVSVFFGDM